MFFACFGWDWVGLGGGALQKAITWQNHANAILRTLFLLALVGLGGGAL